MKKLDVSAVSASNALPFKSGSIIHIQNAYQEAIAEGIKGLIGAAYDPGEVYILNGLVNSGSGSNYNISSGSVFFNGEVYLVDSASFTTTGLQVAVANIVTTFFTGLNADGVEFGDGVIRNIHQIRKVTLSAGLSGSGIGNYASFFDLDLRLKGTLGELKIWKCPGPISDYFSSGLGNHPITLGWAIADGANGTVDMGGFVPVGYKAGDADYDSPFVDSGGNKKITLAADQIPPLEGTIHWELNGSDGTSNSHHIYNGDTEGHGDGYDTTSVTIPNADQQQVDIRQPWKTVLFVQRIA